MIMFLNYIVARPQNMFYFFFETIFEHFIDVFQQKRMQKKFEN